MNHVKKLPFNISRGFTIVEVVVVIVIIGILVGLGGAVYTNYRERSHNDTRATRAQLIASGLEQYYSQHGSYPSVASVTDKGNDTTPQYVAELLGLEEQDVMDPAASSDNEISIVDYDDYATSTDTVYRYRGYSVDSSDPYECHENTTTFARTSHIASINSVAALYPGYCGAFILSYRDTIANEWKEIRSLHNQNLLLE